MNLVILLSALLLSSMAKMIKYIKDSTTPLNKRSERLVDNKIANNGGIILSTYWPIPMQTK